MKATAESLKLKTPITIYGGKTRLMKYVLPLIDAAEAETYVEACVGGGTVFFAMLPRRKSVLNDINNNVTAFYRTLRNNPVQLERRIRATLYSEAEFKKARRIFFDKKPHTDLDRAWAAWTGFNYGFGHSPQAFGFDHDGTMVNSTRRKREMFSELSKLYATKLERAEIDNTDLLHVIKRHDRANTLFYVDPPYFNSDMDYYGGYTESDFEKLLKMLSTIKGKFVLSSYPADVLEKYTKKHGWRTRKITQSIAINNRAGTQRKTKTEVLTWNFDEGHTPSLNGAGHPVFLIARMLEMILHYKN